MLLFKPQPVLKAPWKMCRLQLPRSVSLLNFASSISFFTTSKNFKLTLHHSLKFEDSLRDQALKDHQERTSKDVVHEVLQKICRSTVWKKNMLFQKRTCYLFDKLSQNLTMFTLHSCTTLLRLSSKLIECHSSKFLWKMVPVQNLNVH